MTLSSFRFTTERDALHWSSRSASATITGFLVSMTRFKIESDS